MSEKPEALRLADDFDRSAKRELFRYLDLDKAAAELRRLHAEIERLRDELKEDTGVIAVWRGRTERAESENERLREALALAERLAAGRLAMVEQLTGEVDTLRRENERLRRVLLCLVEACTDEGVRCMDNLLALARAALRREPGDG